MLKTEMGKLADQKKTQDWCIWQQLQLEETNPVTLTDQVNTTNCCRLLLRVVVKCWLPANFAALQKSDRRLAHIQGVAKDWGRMFQVSGEKWWSAQLKS